MARRRITLPPLPEQVVTRPDQLDELCRHLADCPVLAFDTEFVGEDSYRPDLCLIQVATPDRLAVIDPLAVGDVDPFWQALLDPGRTTVAHAGREETRLCWHATGRPPARLFDIQIAAALVGFPFPIGYSGVVQELMGHRTSKAETLTDWRRRPLTPAQMRYAFDDVRFLLPLYKLLTGRLRQLDRLAWADEEMATYTAEWISDDPTGEKWRRVKGLGGLSRRELAVAREVFQWRDAFASRVNRPARQIMRDDLLADIARRSPARADDLLQFRGVPRGEAESIAAAVRKGLALPADQLPALPERDNDPPHVGTLATLLGVVLADLAARKYLAPNLIATGSDLKELVRSRQPGADPLSPDCRLAAGWRAEYIRPELDAVLDGKAVLAVRDPRKPAPLEVRSAGGE
jgi:ribonuclease D